LAPPLPPMQPLMIVAVTITVVQPKAQVMLSVSTLPPATAR
jgi:hypothetical protein